MGLYNTTNLFRRHANIYLEMIGYVRDERKRRILHELFEECEGKADAREKSPTEIILDKSPQWTNIRLRLGIGS